MFIAKVVVIPKREVPCTVLGRTCNDQLTVALHCNEWISLPLEELAIAWKETIPCMMD